MAQSRPLTASLEDYLEAIFCLVQERRVARAKEIAARLNVSMSSVTGALHSLSARGLVNHEPYSHVTLTEEGRRAAERVVSRHNALCRFLTDVLGVNEVRAEESACRMEHVVDAEVLARLVELADFVQKGSGDNCLRRFRERGGLSGGTKEAAS